MKALEACINVFNKIFYVITCGLLVLVVVFCTLQVASRYIPGFQILGMEEAARIAFVWMTMLTLSLGVAYSEHPAVTFLSGKVPARVVPYYAIFLQIVILLFAVILLKFGYQKACNVSNLFSAIWGINMKIIYMSIVVGCVGMVINGIHNIIMIIHRAKGEKNKTAQKEELAVEGGVK